MGPFLSTPFSGFSQKAARGEGGLRKACQKVHKKQLFFEVLRVRLFGEIQGARSRGLGRKVWKVSGAGKEVLEDLFSLPGTPGIWVFPRLSPQRGSRFHTHGFRPVSRLGLREEADPAGNRAPGPKE